MKLKIEKTYPPKLIGKRQEGIWQVVADYQDCRKVVQYYNAATSTQAIRQFLREHGRVVGVVSATLMKTQKRRHYNET